MIACPGRWISSIDLLTGNEIVMVRGRGVGHLSVEDLISLSVSGPMIRAAGVAYDIRKAEPYSIYDRFDFDIPTLPEGDIFARYYIRLLEARESVKILQQALRDIPEGEIMGGKGGYTLRPPEGEAYARVEGAQGRTRLLSWSATARPTPTAIMCAPQLHQPERTGTDVRRATRWPMPSSFLAPSTLCWAK